MNSPRFLELDGFLLNLSQIHSIVTQESGAGAISYGRSKQGEAFVHYLEAEELNRIRQALLDAGMVITTASRDR
jgi:hypothetical protein